MDIYKELIQRLVSFPQRGQIKIDFDLPSKIFCLSVPIFSLNKDLPKSVKAYVEARKNLTFLPHTTSYVLEGNRVYLKQKIPFAGEFQDSLRRNVEDFLQLSKHCHRMLCELGAEETYQSALDSHFSE